MTDRDRLAADLHAARVGCMEPVAVCDPADPRYADFHPATADRLIALGWTRLDEERLARALRATRGDAGDPDGEDYESAAAIAKAYREDTYSDAVRAERPVYYSDDDPA